MFKPVFTTEKLKSLTVPELYAALAMHAVIVANGQTALPAADVAKKAHEYANELLKLNRENGWE